MGRNRFMGLERELKEVLGHKMFWDKFPFASLAHACNLLCSWASACLELFFFFPKQFWITLRTVYCTSIICSFVLDFCNVKEYIISLKMWRSLYYRCYTCLSPPFLPLMDDSVTGGWSTVAREPVYNK